MKGRRLLALSVLTIALACQDNSQPTGPKAPGGPAGLILDGANNGNPDFFFLPPMVSNPVNNPNYEPGKSNNTLARSLTVQICLLDKSPLDTQGNPAACEGQLVKEFGPGEVQLQSGTEGYYQVLWKTRESNLDVTRYYRIKVLIKGTDAGTDAVFGLADVDPTENKSQLKNARTGEVIALTDDSTLPIKFRIENGGGPTLCGGATLCGSGTITNTTPNGEPQFVRVEAPDGSFIAGVLIPSGFLPPPPGPQSVVLTIAGVNTGANDPSTGTQATPCHANLPLQQFNSCFHFRTYPELDPIAGSEEGHQFLKPITVAVCFVLHDAEPRDPREDWVQLWSSDDDREGGDTKPLPSAPVSQILSGPSGENCGDVLVAVNENANAFTRFASAGWQKAKSGLSRVFGVQTAYAVDFGIGGLAFDLSNIGPALTAHIRATTSTEFTVEAGTSAAPTVKIEGTKTHNDHPVYNLGIGDLPVTFTLIHVGSEDPAVVQIVNTGEGGLASFNWTPTEAGNYTITARAQAIGTPVTFTATVDPATIVSAVSSALSLVANSTAEGVLVQDVDGASQTTTLNQLSASVSALSVVGTTSVQTQNSAVATWINAASGSVAFTGVGWTISAPSGSTTNNHAVISNTADWTYTFTATSSGNFTIQYAVTQDAGTTNAFGLNYFTSILIENDVLVDQQFFAVPSTLGTVNQGAVTRPVVAGRTYTVRLGNNANVHFGTYTETAHMSGTFDWSISPPPPIT
jgi:hypothetical protein